MNIGLQIIGDGIYVGGKGRSISRSSSKDKVEITLNIDTAWAIDAIGLHFHTKMFNNGFKEIMNGGRHGCAWI